jgi:hypothetical protein
MAEDDKTNEQKPFLNRLKGAFQAAVCFSYITASISTVGIVPALMGAVGGASGVIGYGIRAVGRRRNSYKLEKFGADMIDVGVKMVLSPAWFSAYGLDGVKKMVTGSDKNSLSDWKFLSSAERVNRKYPNEDHNYKPVSNRIKGLVQLGVGASYWSLTLGSMGSVPLSCFLWGMAVTGGGLAISALGEASKNEGVAKFGSEMSGVGVKMMLSPAWFTAYAIDGIGKIVTGSNKNYFSEWPKLNFGQKNKKPNSPEQVPKQEVAKPLQNNKTNVNQQNISPSPTPTISAAKVNFKGR